MPHRVGIFELAVSVMMALRALFPLRSAVQQRPALRRIVIIAALALVSFFALGDWIFGPELSFGILYLIPVMLCAWVCERWQRLGLCFVCGVTWLMGELSWPETFSEPWIPYWNALLCSGVFVLASELTARIVRQNAALENEIAERKRVECTLRQLNETLEQKVIERTAVVEKRSEEIARSELALRRQAEDLQSILNSMGDGVIVADGDGKILLCNPEAGRLLQMEGSAAQFQDWLERHETRLPEVAMLENTREHPLRIRSDLPLQRAALEGEVLLNVQMMTRAADGSERTAIWSTVPLRNAAGMPAGAVAVGRDITDLKKAEERLARYNLELENIVRERTAKLIERAALLELSFDAIIVRDSRDQITFWNRGAEEIYGWTREEVYGRVTHELFQTRFPEPLPRILQKLRQAGRWSGELIHMRRDGSLVLIATRWSLQLDQAGNPAAILETNTDITESKQTEEALRRSEQELTIFFEESPLGLLWVAPSGLVLRVNRAALELLGCPLEEVQGRVIAQFDTTRELADELLNRLAKGETVRNFRLRLGHKEGLLKHVLVDANGLFDGEKLVYSRWFLRDITRHVELEQEILYISEREQRRLGHDLHDDLCQQLTGIEFLCQTMAAGLEKTSKAHATKAKEVAAMVRAAMVQTRELARGLSPLSLEADGLTVALQQLADRTTKLFGRECRFSCAAPVSVPDQDVGVHVYRIAQEAVANALKHSKADRIEIELQPHGHGFSLKIRDNGIGISQAQNQAAGMGLRIMQYRAMVLGGSLRVENNPQGGTTVLCDLRDRLFLPSDRHSR